MHGEVLPCSSVLQAETTRRNNGLKTRVEDTLPPLSLSASPTLAPVTKPLCATTYQHSAKNTDALLSVRNQYVTNYFSSEIWTECVYCAVRTVSLYVRQVSLSPQYNAALQTLNSFPLLHAPNILPCYQPTFTIRTSGHCLGIFRAVNVYGSHRPLQQM
jgi:hypothetical protein